MKKILCLFFIICIVLLAKAQVRESDDVAKRSPNKTEIFNVLLDTRFDLQTIFQNGTETNRSFYADVLKVAVAGSVTPKIHYYVRQRLNEPQNPNTRDGLSAATEYAWISYDIDERWNVKVGKQGINFGTFEYNYNLADIFLPTMIYSDLVSNEIGVNASYKIHNQVLNVQVVNSPSSQFANIEYKDKALGANFLWQGSLWNGIYKSLWGVATFQHSKDRYYTWLTFGNQINIKKFTLEADYYEGYRNMNYSSVVQDADLGLRYVHDQAISLKFIYDFGKFRPFVKGTWSKRFDKDFDKQAYEIYGAEAVAEYYPFTNPRTKNLRFHAAYIYTSNKINHKLFDAPNLDGHQILVGMRWLFSLK